MRKLKNQKQHTVASIDWEDLLGHTTSVFLPVKKSCCSVDVPRKVLSEVSHLCCLTAA